MVRVPRQRHVYPTVFQTHFFTVVSMQMRYSSLHTDLPKLLCSHKKAPSPYTQVLASIFFGLETGKSPSWCWSILNIYVYVYVTIFKHKQISRFFLGWYTQLCTLHTLNVSVRIPALSHEYVTWKVTYYLQLVADIPPFRSWSAPDLWPTSLHWLNRYALP